MFRSWNRKTQSLEEISTPRKCYLERLQYEFSNENLGKTILRCLSSSTRCLYSHIYRLTNIELNIKHINLYYNYFVSIHYFKSECIGPNVYLLIYLSQTSNAWHWQDSSHWVWINSKDSWSTKAPSKILMDTFCVPKIEGKSVGEKVSWKYLLCCLNNPNKQARITHQVS